MGTSKSEFAKLVEDLWNPMARQVPYARPLEGDAMLDWLWRRLSRFEPAIIRQAMEKEFDESRPDVRGLYGHCRELCPAPPKPPQRTGRYDISRVFPFDMTGDQSEFARLVCDSEILDQLDPAWFDQAVRLIRVGKTRPYRWADGSALDWTQMEARYIERKGVALRLLNGRTPEQWRAEAQAWTAKIFGLGRKGAERIGDVVKRLLQDEDVEDAIPF